MQNVLTRRGLIQAGAISALPGLWGVHARAATPDLSGVTLRIGVYRGMDATILPATGQANFPYRVAYGEFSAGNLITQAIAADALDLGSGSEIPLVFAAASHADFRVVAIMQGPTVNQAVLIPKDSTAKSIADLRGKRVGYIRATTAHYFLIKMLAQHGMSFADIQPVALGMSAGLTAMKSGALDAWATYGYAIATLEADVGARVLQDARGILSGNYLVGARPEKLGDPSFRAAVADYLTRLRNAYATLDADKPRWAKLVAPVVGVPEPIALAYLREEEQPYVLRAIRPADIKSAQNVAKTFAEADVLPPDANVSGYFSNALSPLLAFS